MSSSLTLEELEAVPDDAEYSYDNEQKLFQCRIGGAVYDVWAVDNLEIEDGERSVRGIVIYRDRNIFIDNDQGGEAFIEVLIHEALHAMDERYTLSIEDESKINAIAAHMTDFLILNPQITTLICEEANNGNTEL